MAKQRYINTKIWEDAWFNALDPIEKLFFVYLLTNPMTNIAGIYELSKGTIGRSTGLESRVVDEILARFERSEKVYYRDGWVVIRNFIKHQNYKSPKIVIGLKAEFENIPENIAHLANIPKDLYGMDTVSHFNTNTNTNINTSDEVSHEDIVRVIDAFEWNVAHSGWYKNKTQRDACKTLIENFGLDKVLTMVESLPKINEIPYVTSATTPKQLLDKYATIQAQLNKQKLAVDSKKHEII